MIIELSAMATTIDDEEAPLLPPHPIQKGDFARDILTGRIGRVVSDPLMCSLVQLEDADFTKMYIDKLPLAQCTNPADLWSQELYFLRFFDMAATCPEECLRDPQS